MPGTMDLIPLHTILLLVNLDGIIAQSADTGLFPVVFNLAARASITTNATCGENGPERYCRLVEHVRRRPEDRIQCGICDANSSDDADKHPIQNAIDGSNNWWQSPSIAEGSRYNWVTITVDLRQVYQVAYVIVKAANSPRPGNWILERSLDGINFSPWQYFASSDSECLSLYGIRPTIGIPRYRHDSHVICTSSYSRLDPLQNGEIHISLVNGRPGVSGPSEQLQEFTSTRHIRLRLQKVRTLNADLMMFMSHDRHMADQTVTNRYFYSIKDISVGGQCICYGHARYCPFNSETGELQCTCERNTCGKSCEKCCPLFNQKPWKPGTYVEGNVCEECNCFGHAQECAYNETVADSNLSLNIYGEYEGGGVCLDCQDKTMGVNCELCQDGYYRPSEVDHRRPDACRPCNCDGEGSVGICIKDDNRKAEGLCAGDCVCREGFGGMRCDQCAPGFKNFPLCEPCPCDSAGSINFANCEDDCRCKAHVQGETCDMCLPGFYNLQQDHYDGCEACFCFGITRSCYSSTLRAIKIDTKQGWVVTDVANTGRVLPVSSEEGLTIETWQTENLGRMVYWSAPQTFLGNKVASYGGVLEYSFKYDVNGTCDNEEFCESYLANHDVIIEGGGLRLGYQGRYYPDSIEGLVAMNMTEDDWRYLDLDRGRPQADNRGDIDTLVSREDFLLTLAQLERLLIRGTYHVFQTKSMLFHVTLQVADENGDGAVMPSVEVCQCPPGYAGTSCETCQAGYRRVGNMLLGGTCEPCMCHGHSTSCDPYTGECLNCEHNTQGAHCELCQIGYIGDALQGTFDDCRPCACPLPMASNSFAQGCVHDPHYPNREYVCVGCHPGYDGLSCEWCSDGYFGDPMVPGSSCQPCDCHGNVNLTAPGSCNVMSGECQGCLSNTEGPHCERCKEGYYGTAMNGDCKTCACNVFGSHGSMCDPVSGQCECRERYAGLDCGQCEPGYGNVESGCVPCDCDFLGSSSDLCDLVTGQCPCKPGVGGLRCEKCRAGHHDFSQDGCSSCRCYEVGTNGTACDAASGQCDCLPNVIGQYCDVCDAEHWGLHFGNGCEPCACNTTGSLSSQCELTTGQCQCKTGISGQKCDECMPGYYGFSSYGCQECPICSDLGKVCDPVTGECVCPPNTEGAYCEKCVANSWGRDPLKGCQSCQCNMTGSVGNECDAQTGACVCHNAFTGDKCDHCHRGYFDFPVCRPCSCDPAGTQAMYCDTNGQCECTNNGTCPCKENVGHEKCVYCKQGSFSLQVANPKGCTSCYCFGRTSECRQAEMMWSQVTFNDVEVSFEYYNPRTLIYQDVNGLLAIPFNQSFISIDPRRPNIPLYWTMTPLLHGDKILSYGGRLQFHIESVPDPTPSQAPLVHLIGNYRLHLVYPMPQAVAEDGTYMVTFREDLWTTDEGGPVSRDMMMVALQNVQKIFVFAAPMANITEARLNRVLLDVAVPSPGSTPGALGVEQCDCPPEYGGTSCQNPAIGFYRRRPEAYITTEIIVDLVGYSEPCLCNDHSDVCDPETGICQNCQHNAAGEHCEFCRNGYYGNATIGTPFDCEQCGCPLYNPENNPSCVPTLEGDDYMCTACPEGHMGSHCERCAPGYYGNPLRPGDNCSRCDCSPQGSQDDLCDGTSGQCVCRPGIQGRACDQCSPRYALINGVCTSCDEGCSGIIMADIDMMMASVENYNTSAEVLLPWRQIGRMEKESQELRKLLTNIEVANLDEMQKAVEEERARLEDVKTELEASSPKKTYEEARRQGRDSAKEIEGLIDSTLETHRYNEDTVRMLREFEVGQKQNGYDMEAAVQDAENTLWQLRSQTFVNRGINVEEEHEKSEEKYDRMKQLAMRQTNLTRVKTHSKDVNDRLKDLVKLTVEVSNVSSNAMDMNWRDKQHLYDLTQQTEEAGKWNEKLHQTLGNATEINEKASALLWNLSSSNYRPVCILDPAKYAILNETEYQDEACVMARQKLRDSEDSLRVKGGLLEQNLPEVRPVLDEAHEHARELQRTADNLERMFAGTRTAAEDPLRAAKAYSDITDSIDEAEIAAEEASKAAEEAVTQSQTVDGKLLRERARESLVLSKELLLNASNLNTAIRKTLEDKQTFMRKEEVDITSTQEDLDDVNQQLMNMSSGVSPTVRVLNYRATKAEEKASNILSNLTEKIDKLEEAGPMLRQVTRESIELFRKANSSVTSAEEEVKKVLNLTDVLTERIKVIEEIQANVTLNLDELRRNIKLAREQANSIKLSMKSTGDCNRKYKPKLQPATTSTIVFHFTSNRTENNMMLFFVGSQDHDEYMAVELIQDHVRFTWNNGDGPTFIEHELLVEPAYLRTNAKDRWYKVDAQRTGNVGRLSVTTLSMTEDPQVVTGVSSPGHSTLDLDENAYLYVGGIPSSSQPPGNIKTRQFIGCIGAVYFDGEHLGLWNFRDIEGTCEGCGYAPVPVPPTEVYQFQGDGFASLDPLPYFSGSRYSVNFQIKTYWQNALLFFSSNDEKGDFVSIELKDGQVVFRISQDGQKEEKMVSRYTYNNNNWVMVTAGWESSTAMMRLRVEDEIVQERVSRSGDAMLDLESSKLHFAGLPPNMDVSRYDLETTGFLGCMRNIQVSSRGSYAQNLNNGVFAGMELGCKAEAWREVGLGGDGFLELPPEDLLSEAGLSFSFRTLQPDALLLIAMATNSQNFYSVSLQDGRVVAWFSGGQGLATVQSTKKYNDGELHSVSFMKKDDVVDAFVDDEQVGSAVMPPGGRDINNLASEGSLYLGGVPREVDVTGKAASDQALQGCLSDIILNKKLKYLDAPKDFQRADVGRCAANRIFPQLGDTTKVPPFEIGTSTEPMSYTVTITQPTTPTTPTTTPGPTTTTAEPTFCAKKGRYGYVENAVTFGDVKNSHAEIVVDPNEVNEQFTITLEMRTMFKTGLLLYITNEKQKDFVAVQLNEGRLILSYDDRGITRDIDSQSNLDGGGWHAVTVKKDEQSISLQVDTFPVTTGRITRRVDVSAPLYVGGLPRAFRATAGIITESFKGCMRSFYLNKEYVDLVNSKAVMGVRQCFSRFEEGTHLDGYGYAVYDEEFEIASDFEAAFEFRTTEMNGIFLSTSDFSGYPALAVELHDGKLKFNVVDYYKETFSVESDVCEHCLCDNRWHSVSVRMRSGRLYLQLDDKPQIRGTGSESSLDTYSELFIGGFPVYAMPQGATHTGKFFEGCIKNVSIQKEPLSWHSIYRLVDIHVADCPISID